MRRPVILMLEHDEDDRYVTQAFLDENQHNIQIDYVRNSDDFFSYLSQRASQELPSLILLNQHAAPMNALQILKQLKSSEDYSHIPVVVLSGSKSRQMVRECYALGANSFIQKPDSSHATDHKISSFIQYWFETVELT